MFLDALFRGEPLENSLAPVTGGATETDNILARDVYVGPETSMELTTVYACIYATSFSVAQMSLHVVRKTNEHVRPTCDHSLLWLVHNEPSVWQTSYRWRELKQRHVLGRGDGYTWVKCNRHGGVTSLEYCMPWKTTLLSAGGYHTYGVYSEEGAPAVSPDNMTHTRVLGSDQKVGLSLIMQHAETIGTGMSGQQCTDAFSNGNTRLAGIVSVKNELNEQSWGRFKGMQQQAVTALRSQENKTMLLPVQLDYRALAVSPAGTQIIDMTKLNRSMTAGIFNAPTHTINDLEKATLPNIAQQAIQFVCYTVMLWIANQEQEFNRCLFTRAERAAGYYVHLNLMGLPRGTPQERAQFYHFAITDGWMGRNKTRTLEDMNPADGLDKVLVDIDVASPLNNSKGMKGREERNGG